MLQAFLEFPERKEIDEHQPVKKTLDIAFKMAESTSFSGNSDDTFESCTC